MRLKLIILLIIIPFVSYSQGQQWQGAPNQLNGWYGGITANKFLRLPHGVPNFPFDSCGRIWFDSALTKAIYFNDCNNRVQILSKNDTNFIKSLFHDASVDSSIFATRWWVLSQGFLTASDSATFATKYWVAQQLLSYMKYDDTISLSNRIDNKQPLGDYLYNIVPNYFKGVYIDVGQNTVIQNHFKGINANCINNTVIGSEDSIGGNPISGTGNTLVGVGIGKFTTNDTDNTMIGNGTWVSGSGIDNTGIGEQALKSAIGNNMIALGDHAGQFHTGDTATIIGSGAGMHDTCSACLIVGYWNFDWMNVYYKKGWAQIKGSWRKSGNDTTDGKIYNHPAPSSNSTDSIVTHNLLTNAFELRAPLDTTGLSNRINSKFNTVDTSYLHNQIILKTAYSDTGILLLTQSLARKTYQPIAAAVNVTGINYTLSNANNGQQIYCNNINGTSIVIPTGLQDSFTCTIYQNSAGRVFITTASGITIHNFQALTAIKSAGIYSRIIISHSPTVNTFIVSGDIVTNPALLLNTYTTAWGAYSFSRINNNYSGYAFHIRRASDNTFTYIGFDSTGHFDTLTRQSFCAATTCYVDTAFDQTGNRNHFTQPVSGNQPQINDSELIFDGSTSFLVDSFSTAPYTFTGDGQFYCVVSSATKNPTAGNIMGPLISQSSKATFTNELLLADYRTSLNKLPGALYGEGTGWFYGTADHNINQYYLTTFSWQNWSTCFTNGNTKIYFNNAENTPYLKTASTNPSGLGTTLIELGKQVSGFPPYFFNGKMKMVIIYPNNTNNISNLNTAINALQHVF